MSNSLILDHGKQNSSHELVAMVGKVALIIFTVELAIMFGFDFISPDLGPVATNVVDSLLLTLLASPVIYFAVAEPFVEAARTANMKLHNQLQESSRLLRVNVELQDSLRRASEDVGLAHDRILQKVGADLHDGPAQLLAYALLRFDSVADLAAKAGMASDDVARIRGVLADTMREVRAISKGLSLPQLSKLTLEDTVRLAALPHAELDGADITFDVRDLPADAPVSQKVCVYRVIQEALANARKHAKADKITVKVHGGEAIRIEITDNGVGFQGNGVNAGLGLCGMMARVHALGGDIEIADTGGAGVKVSAIIPLGSDHPAGDSEAG